jgi:hypothetical protein
MPTWRNLGDWLIVIINVPVLLLGLVIGGAWAVDAFQHYQAEDNHPNIRLGMCIGFIMAYLIWNSVAITYLILKRRTPTGMVLNADVYPVATALPTATPVSALREQAKAVLPPTPVKPSDLVAQATSATSATPQWLGDLAEVQKNDRGPADFSNPAPADWIPDVGRTETIAQGDVKKPNKVG